MSSAVYELLTRENVVFKAYAFWASVLILKTLAMALLTAMQRFRTKVRLKLTIDTILEVWH